MIFAPNGTLPWARSHAALPAPLKIDADIFRVFFSARDSERRSHVSWVDVDLSSAPRIVRQASHAVLSPGEDGAFDDSGVGIGCITPTDEGVRLYYMGWNLGVRAAWRNAIGFAQSQTPFDRFERFSPGPILDRSPEDPYTLSYPCVVRFGSNDWRMWYGSNLTADTSNTGMSHTIKSARSGDGIRWTRDGYSAISFSSAAEYAMARPTVTKLGDVFLMCFACRGDNYRIGAVWSRDTINWLRIDETMGLGPDASGWDSEMTCYPALFQHQEKLYMAYNGNSYGSSGFGFAVWEGDYPF